MRNAFANEVTQLAKTDSRIVLLSGDIGNKLFDEFKGVDSNRFYNCGIAEGNMMGVAAGMALSGLRPIVYTITPFTTTRCFEQIRVDVCYHEAPVIIVGTGSGLSYAELGATHHSLEDLAILRTLPGMTVMAPCDANELRAALRAALMQDTPTYIRIGKKGEMQIFDSAPDLQIGKAAIISPGSDVSLICTGTLMGEAVIAADLLKKKGLSVELVSMHTVKPLDVSYLKNAAKRFKLMVSIEEHGIIGGLSGAISEWRSKNSENIPHLSLGTPDIFLHEVGSQEYARKKFSLLGYQIASTVLDALNG